jgi:K+-sensing histidine kinase KdpD
MNAEFSVLYVESAMQLREADRHSLEANIQFAENVRARVVRLTGKSIPVTAAEYVAKIHITQSCSAALP